VEPGSQLRAAEEWRRTSVSSRLMSRGTDHRREAAAVTDEAGTHQRAASHSSTLSARGENLAEASISGLQLIAPVLQVRRQGGQVAQGRGGGTARAPRPQLRPPAGSVRSENRSSRASVVLDSFSNVGSPGNGRLDAAGSRRGRRGEHRFVVGDQRAQLPVALVQRPGTPRRCWRSGERSALWRLRIETRVPVVVGRTARGSPSASLRFLPPPAVGAIDMPCAASTAGPKDRVAGFETPDDLVSRTV